MKVNLILNKKREVMGYRTYPLDLSEPVIELADFPKDLALGNYKYENHTLVKQTKLSESPEDLGLSSRRERLLKAFQEYRNNVNYGILTESEKTHEEMLEWLKRVNQKDASSITNPPTVILAYLEDKSWI